MDKQIRILVVDDEPEICHLIEKVLRPEGYQIDVCFSGIEALQMIMIHSYHLLLTDLAMPGGVDGLELVRKVREKDPEIIIIMLTGNAVFSTTLRKVIHEVEDYLIKPFNIFELKNKVKEALFMHQGRLDNEKTLQGLKERVPISDNSRFA